MIAFIYPTCGFLLMKSKQVCDEGTCMQVMTVAEGLDTW